METTILTLEITPELDEALEKFAKDFMVTKEDIAVGILATQFSKARSQKAGFLGFSQKTVLILVTMIASAFADAIATSNKEKASEKGAE